MTEKKPVARKAPVKKAVILPSVLEATRIMIGGIWYFVKAPGQSVVEAGLFQTTVVDNMARSFVITLPEGNVQAWRTD